MKSNKSVFKKFCFSASAFMLLSVVFLIHRADGAQLVDRIVAEVNDEIITLTELNEVMKPFIARMAAVRYSDEDRKQMIFKIREDVLSGLIDQKLTDQQAKQLNLIVSDRDIDETIERIKETNFLTDEDLRRNLSYEGVTIEDYRMKLKDQILRTKLVNLEVKSKIVVTKEDIQTYYDAHRNQFSGEVKYHLRHILLKATPESDPSDKLRVRQKLEEILAMVNAGRSFENMAKRYSESSLAKQGGDLGLFDFNDLSPTLQKMVKTMKAGDVSPIVDTDQGYQIFFVEDIVKSPDKTLEEASAGIQDRIYKEKTDEKFNSWLEELHKQSHIKIIK